MTTIHRIRYKIVEYNKVSTGERRSRLPIEELREVFRKSHQDMTYLYLEHIETIESHSSEDVGVLIITP